MKTSENINNVMTAIGKVQQIVPALKREATGSTGKREYKYTTLDKIWESVSQALKDNSLMVTQSPTTGESNMGDFFRTTIFHMESGEFVEETMMMRVTNDDPQKIGSAITYYRRYMLVSMLGLIVQGDDNDATDHKLATAQQKVRIIGAAKMAFPEHQTQAALINAIKDVIGKHPTYIRLDEAEDAIATIEAFADKKSGINQEV